MRKLMPFLLMILYAASARAQAAIPVGSWRTHFSYTQVHEVALAGDRVYAASENGFFYYDKPSQEIFVLGPLRGFSDVGVSALAWQPGQNRLLIGYRSGNIDLLQEGSVTNISTISNAQFSSSKTIRAGVFRGDSALLATDYGISIINMAQSRLVDSYLNLGPEGGREVVYDLAILQDTIYATTATGVLTARLTTAGNLNDFRSWHRLGELDGLPLSGSNYVEALGEQLWLLTNGGRLYRRLGNGWAATSFNLPGTIRDLQASQEGDALLITMQNGVHRYLIATDTYTSPAFEQLKDPLTAVYDREGSWWIGDRNNGLVHVQDGEISLLNPAGPLSDAITALVYANEQVMALSGGRSFSPAAHKGFSVFTPAEGWINHHPEQQAGSRAMPDAQDIRAAAYATTTRHWYFASYSDGLLAWQPADNSFELFGLNTPGTSFVEEPAYPGKVLLNSIGVDGEGNVWMGNYNSIRPLHRYRPAENNWQAFLEGNYTASQAQQILIPYTNDIWLRLAPQSTNTGSILVFNPQKQPQSRLLGNRSGEGGFVSDESWVIREDLEGSIWIGTDDGLSYLPDLTAVLSDDAINALLPVYQQRPLLDESRITALAVDGGNRKWIGTGNGLWLFGDAGDTLYHHFTTANSPLPSNTIVAVVVHDQTGEVFIATDKGMVSYRGNATVGGSAHASAIKIFPNPVRPGFRGQVGITGLVQDAVVKITNTAGFLVRELPAEGGSTAWDMRDSRGNRVAPGVYLVFSANELGTEALVGKVAIVR